MQKRFRTGVAVAVAAAAAIGPAAGLASSSDDHAGPASCAHPGKGYEVQGLLVAGSSLSQVKGSATDRAGDDRFDGVLVVDVKQGNRRGRADLGLHSYSLSGVRVHRGSSAGSAVPAVGTRVLIVGQQRSAADAKRCQGSDDAGEATTPTSPAATTPDPSSQTTTFAARLRDSGVPAADPATDVTVRLVRFGREGGAGAPGKSGSHDPGETPSSPKPSGDHPAPTSPKPAGDDGSSDDGPAATTPKPTEDHPAATTPKPTGDRPAATTPKPTGDRPAATTPKPNGDRPAATTPKPTGDHRS
jgi:hypothetical protein